MLKASKIDILILGAGPAGCAAALAARQAGLSVVLVEARQKIPNTPGETLHPGVEPIMKQLGVWDDVIEAGFHRQHGVWRENEGVRKFTPYGSDEYGEWKGFQADRRILHTILQRAARHAGASLIPLMAPQNIIWHENQIAGICFDQTEIHAHWIFDATGRQAWLATQMQLQSSRPGPPLQVRYGWIEGRNPELDQQPLFIQRPSGWSWQAPLGDGRTAWTEMALTTSLSSVQPGLDMQWRLYPACAGAGYFLLGDAAALLDPSASNGVLRALMSGILATHSVVSIMGGSNESSVTQAYKTWIAELFNHQVTKLLELYHAPGSTNKDKTEIS